MAERDASGVVPPIADANWVVKEPEDEVARAKAPLTVLLNVMLLLFVIVEAAVSVTGADEGKVKTLAPVSEMLPPTEIALALFVMTRFVKGAELPIAAPKVIAPVPGVNVSEVAPLIVLVAPEKVIFWLPAVVSTGDPETVTGPVIEIAPDVVVVILPPILMAVDPV